MVSFLLILLDEQMPPNGVIWVGWEVTKTNNCDFKVEMLNYL